MAEVTKNRVTRMLLSKERRVRYAQLFACLAMCVAIIVAALLHLTGIAMVHEETMLTCPVAGVVAHTHDASCYDEDGELVCPLPELEAHVHTDECYTEAWELTCGLEESDGHQHTDGCYTVTYDLTCGKDEITEEHVHGPGCFTTVTVHDDDSFFAESSSTDTGDAAMDASAHDANTTVDTGDGEDVPDTTVEVEGEISVEGQSADEAESDLPAQEFEAEILDEKGDVWVSVSVRAPEGAFPLGTTMKIEPIDAEAMRDAVDSAIQKENETQRAKHMKGVDIKFFDKDGAEIEPSEKVEVSITSTTVRDIKNPVLVHVSDKTSDATIVGEVSVVNQRDNDTTTGTEDTLRFDASEFSPYIIVEMETIGTEVITAEGETYIVSVSYGPEAKVPAGATLEVEELNESAADYDTYAKETADALYAQVADLSHLRIFNITILDEDGNEVEPEASVEVKVTYVGNVIEHAQDLQVVHLAESGTEVIAPEVESVGSESDEIDTVTFTTDSFSLYAIAANGYGVTGNLDGKSLAIIHVSSNPINTDAEREDYRRRIGQALMDEIENDGLLAQGVKVENHDTEKNVVTETAAGVSDPENVDATVTSWKFKATGNENKYYIYVGEEDSEEVSYLHVNETGKLSLSDKNDKQSFKVEAGTGSDAGTVKISTEVGGTTYYVRSSIKRSTNTKNDANPHFTANPTFSNEYCYLTLAEISLVDPSAYAANTVYTGTKTSATKLQDGGSYLIYRNVYNETTGKYEDYVIDGNGGLVRAYDKGDIVTLHSAVSVLWTLQICLNDQEQPSGYYVFLNEETGKYLHPLYDGTLVAEWASASTNRGVKLAGREQDEYTSTIEYWNGVESSMAYYGYKIENQSGFMTLVTATGSDSKPFSFAENKEETTVNPNKVDTVDSISDGIRIRMFDYGERPQIYKVTGSDSYAAATLPAQHVKPTLGTDGYPQFIESDLNNGEKSGALLFDPNNEFFKGEANHLFLKSIYETTHYYEYSSFNNFARYDKDKGEFVLYDELGTPVTTHPKFSYWRGNFMPFNDIDTSVNAKHTTNLFNADGELLDYEDATNGKTVYGLKGSANYYFGMTMDFYFVMPKSGCISGNPLIYEFNGDDDLWVYVDGVLLLDIGGVHNAWSGSINFETGQIEGRGAAGKTGKIVGFENTGTTTIKACFEAAGIFPDGTTWDNSKVDEYFNGDTFVDYGGHTFNMFYMEHGAGASTLAMRFNLPVVERDEVAVAKKLDNTSQTDYANVQFAYQAFKKATEDGADIPLRSAVRAQEKDDTYEKVFDEEGNPVEVTFYDDVDIDGHKYDNVFYLKPREAAIFSEIAADQEYYVQEIGIKNDYYDKIVINGVEIDGMPVEADSEYHIYKSDERTARNRQHVIFTNHCDNRNTNELLITKELAKGTKDVGDTFEFRVMLENRDGKLVAYNEGPYYVKNKDGEYCRFENGTYVSNGFTKPSVPFKSGLYGTIANIPAGYTVEIEDLVADTDFYVDEIRVRPAGAAEEDSLLLRESNWNLDKCELIESETEGYGKSEIDDATILDYATQKNVTGSSLGRIEWNKNAHVVFTNSLSTTDVLLRKVDVHGNNISGSSFVVTRWDGKNWADDGYVSGLSPIKPGGEDAEGEPIGNPCSISDLTGSRYRLEEAEAPAGYNILTKYVYFEVYKDGGAFKVALLDGDDLNNRVESIEGLASIEESNDGIYTIAIVNTPGFGLPNTGGEGTRVYTIAGATLVIAALTYGIWSLLKARMS